jgi:uncharacterized protein (TIGR03083 family)
MQLTPRYGADPVLTLDGEPGDILGPLVRQRRRLAAALAAFDEAQWRHPSRCAGWSSRDVVVHLDSTNAFWTFSIAAGLRGEPTRFLATFDPVSSPAQLVAGSGEMPAGEVLERFVASTEAFADLLASIDGDGWSRPAEAPPGHIAVAAVAHHALWDSWVHERDILLPLGVTPDVEDDEVIACLRYGAGLGPALALDRGRTDRGVLAVEVTGPDLSVVVDIGDRVEVRCGPASPADLTLRGDALAVLEALSVRGPFPHPIPPSSTWMLDGLTETFDVELAAESG